MLWAVLTSQIYKCFEKFLSEPTYFDVQLKDQRNAPFPDLTICSAMAGGLKTGVLKVKVDYFLEEKYTIKWIL